MQHQPYPEFKLECVTTLIDIGRRGAIREEIRDFAKCAYDLGGGLLKVTVGEPDDVIVGATSDGEEQLAECSLEQLEEAHNVAVSAFLELESYGALPGALPGAEEAIDPATLTLIMQLVLKALEFWMNRKKS